MRREFEELYQDLHKLRSKMGLNRNVFRTIKKRLNDCRLRDEITDEERTTINQVEEYFRRRAEEFDCSDLINTIQPSNSEHLKNFRRGYTHNDIQFFLKKFDIAYRDDELEFGNKDDDEDEKPDSG